MNSLWKRIQGSGRAGQRGHFLPPQAGADPTAGLSAWRRCNHHCRRHLRLLCIDGHPGGLRGLDGGVQD